MQDKLPIQEGIACAFWVSKPPATRPAWPSTTPPRACCAHALYSQIALHADYGGVVPELASRDHVRKLLPLVRQTLQEAGLALGDLDGVAYTAGPGLVGALLVGAAAGRALAWALDVPAIGVHHMEGHLLAPAAGAGPAGAALRRPAGLRRPHPAGGRGRRSGATACSARSLDDAAGEAFDKTAKMMGLPYPGGPELAPAGRIRPARAVQVLPRR